MIKLLVAIPTAGVVCIDTAYSLANMVGAVAADPPSFPFQMRLTTACGSNWIENRETLAESAVEGGFTHLMFIDDDMVWNPAILSPLLDRVRNGCDIVTCNYMVKTEPPDTFTAIGLDGRRVRTTAETTGLEEVAANGFGVSIISTDVFKRIPQPWFMPTWSREIGYSTEDVPFFRRCREHGFKVWVDHDASKAVAHVGRKQWSWKQAV